MAFEIRSQGRELSVKFTCSRCGITIHLPYDKVMIGEHYGYLHNSELPDGWEKEGYSRIFCSDCAAAFKKFMEVNDG